MVIERFALIDLEQQQDVDIGSDRAAAECNHHAAALVGLKLQEFGGTLCRHRFSFKNLVSSF